VTRCSTTLQLHSSAAYRGRIMADQMHVSRFCVRRYTIVITAWSRE
jgi:hypothetical protein